MPIQRAKPFTTLYDEVEGYDLVLVPDAPLASALNRHLDVPHLGEFATTPRRAAAGRREQVEERTVFLELLHETDLSWKQASYIGEEIIHCWEYTGRPDGVLEFDQFDNPDVREAVEHAQHLDTTSRFLTDYTVDESLDLAVVGYPQLTPLERSILPADYDRIDRFAEGTFDRPPFRLFDTAADIVGAVLDAISSNDPAEVAVVLDAGSEFSTLVESALDAADVPFYGGSGFLDDADHRAFLNLLRAGFRGRDVRVADVRPVLEHVGLTPEVDHDEKRLHALDLSWASRFQGLCDAVRDGAWIFEEALTEYESILDTTTLTVGDLIRFISRGIERGSTHEVNTSAAENSVTVQTIHATKGLEHPIVIQANVNSRRFPPSGGGSPPVFYDDAAGLRHRKTFAEAHDQPYVYDNWKTDVLTWCLNRNYDEERRLLYVSITRAENHVRFTAGENPNTFLEELPVGIEPGHTTVGDIDVSDDERSPLRVASTGKAGPTQYSPHSLIDTSVYEDVEDGRGTEFGTRVHDFAEALVVGEEVTPQNDDEEHITEFVDPLEGELRPEEAVYLPLDTSEGQVTLSGGVDLLDVTPESVDIIDYKTDRGRHAESEYRKQLSVYYHVLSGVYPERTISASIFYTETGQRVAIDPLSESALERLVEKTVQRARRLARQGD